MRPTDLADILDMKRVLRDWLDQAGFFWVVMKDRSRPEVARIEDGLCWPTIGHGEPVPVANVNILSGPLTYTRGLSFEE